MQDIEQGLMPNFNSKIMKEILPFAEGYYNMTEENDLYIYNDGNHLQTSSGEKVTEKIARFIKNPA
jgi:hypothetical protein